MCGPSLPINILPAAVTGLSLAMAVGAGLIGKGETKPISYRIGAGVVGFFILQLPALYITACGPDAIVEGATIPAAILIGLAYGKPWFTVRSIFIGAASLVQMVYGPLIIKR